MTQKEKIPTQFIKATPNSSTIQETGNMMDALTQQNEILAKKKLLQKS